MSLVTLHADERGWLGSGRLVFGADEAVALDEAIAMARHLGELARERDARLAEATARGVEEGRARGLELGRREASARIAEALDALAASQREAVERQREAVLSLALEVVRRVAPSIPRERWLVALAREAAADLAVSPRRVLRVHPDAVAAVEAGLREAGDVAFDAVRPDASLGPDEAEIDTGAGSLRIDLEAQLHEIGRALDA